MVFSDKWAQIIGYSINEFGTVDVKVLETITHPDDFNKSRKLLEEHFSGELPYYKHENRIKHKNGHWVWICERGCITERTEDGKPLIMFGTHTDITKRKEIEQALENYISILNHDLRNPLTIIMGYSSYLLEEELSKDDIKKFSNIINITGKKMLKMIESYLALAKIERGQDILGKKPKTVGDVISIIKTNFINLSKNNKISILLKDLHGKSFSDNLTQRVVLIDEILFESLINNLIRNAIDGSSKTGDEIIINIYKEEGFCLSFFNTGEIPKEIQKKLFKKFISSKKNGSGIGLYSARLIARAHGGDLFYQSELGGTRFILKIPFK
jgi:PAS domain S-box-containing protein